MNLVEQLDKDMIEAMKNHEKERLTVIREVKAGMKQANIDQKKEISDEIEIINFKFDLLISKLIIYFIKDIITWFPIKYFSRHFINFILGI